MATPLLDHEVLRLNNSNYMKLVLATLQHLKNLSATNYSDLFDEVNASVYIENSSKEKVQFKFRSDNILSCSGSFSFKHGKLDSFTYTIKPASYFKKRICKKQYQRIVAMLAKISDAEGGDVETITDTAAKFSLRTGSLSVIGGPNMLTSTQMVTITFTR